MKINKVLSKANRKDGIRSLGQAMVEFGLTFGMFLIVVIITVVSFTFLGVLAVTYYGLNYMASQFVTDGRVARGFAILESDESEARELFSQAFSEAMAAGNSFVTGLFGQLFLEDLTVNGEDLPRKVVLFLPPQLGQDRVVTLIGSYSTDIRYDNLLPQDSPCRSANQDSLTNCPAIGYAYLRFTLPFGLSFGFGVRSFEVIDSRSLRSRGQSTPLAASTPFYETPTPGSSTGSTGNPLTPTPTRTVTPCPYRTVSFTVDGDTHTMRCDEAMDSLSSQCSGQTSEYCEALENALETLLNPCRSKNLEVSVCDDGTCNCQGGGGD